MVELADTKDLKSFGSDSVPVQVRLAAPSQTWDAGSIPGLAFLSCIMFLGRFGQKDWRKNCPFDEGFSTLLQGLILPMLS